MSNDNDEDLKRTQELYDFLQGIMPKDIKVTKTHQPKLTADQAWVVIWYLGNQYWQVTDRVERCGVCGNLYHAWQEGDCLDYGNEPYHFCDPCLPSEEYLSKSKQQKQIHEPN